MYPTNGEFHKRKTCLFISVKYAIMMFYLYFKFTLFRK